RLPTNPAKSSSTKTASGLPEPEPASGTRTEHPYAAFFLLTTDKLCAIISGRACGCHRFPILLPSTLVGTVGCVRHCPAPAARQIATACSMSRTNAPCSARVFPHIPLLTPTRAFASVEETRACHSVRDTADA